ncbi:hypothetical protein MTBLM5_140022 [Magnetospirillum sp. LM-5]|uniref:PAS domain S-box protein n=1 Tax=Magnetospirillum sp. LM-5 TaxID=2681466 RepID=UPI0013827EFA|nr:PAS domain S-box protein [Magnetospirillum sp. LM-5]CAA7614698.1 hypothetical protein MTBLM5_140022 [Magnetospirillum sp. LM-5]
MTSEIERAALLLNESRFRLALANSPIVVFEQDLDLRYTWIFNPKLGYAAQEVIGKTDDDIMEAGAARAIGALKRSVMKSGEPKQQEVLASAPNGPISYYDLNIEPRYDGNGEIIGVICSATDITERKLAEQAREISAQKSRDQLTAFIRYAPVSMAMFDMNMNYMSVSDRWIKEFGKGHSDLIGLNHYQLLPDMPLEWKIVHQRCLAGASMQNDEDLWVQADGSKYWLRWAVQPWTDFAGVVSGIIIAAEDITEKMEAKAELIRTSQAKQSFWERLANLTDRERQVLSGALRGMGNKAIAAHLHASTRTVEGHRARIYIKARISNVIEIVNEAAAVGLTLAEIIAHLDS